MPQTPFILLFGNNNTKCRYLFCLYSYHALIHFVRITHSFTSYVTLDSHKPLTLSCILIILIFVPDSPTPLSHPLSFSLTISQATPISFSLLLSFSLSYSLSSPSFTLFLYLSPFHALVQSISPSIFLQLCPLRSQNHLPFCSPPLFVSAV